VLVNNFNPKSKTDNSESNSLNNWPIYYRSIYVHETDKDGVVHFSNYCKVAEEAMFNGFQALGFSFKNSGYSVAMINISINYINPIEFGDQIAVVPKSFTIKRVKLFLTLEFYREQNLMAEIKLTFATILNNERKVILVPANMREKLSSAVGE